jgi:hypothetical protein
MKETPIGKPKLRDVADRAEIWFSKIQRDVISRGVFTSTKDLASKPVRLHPQLQQNGDTDPLDLQECRS